ncbi:tyrosine-type recombinase/integrase [Desulfatiferula olefinivorans]
MKGFVTDENRFVNHIEPAFGSKEPFEILPLDVDRVRLKLLKSHSKGTVRNVLELLRRIINFGVKKNLCNGLNFTIEMPKLNNEKTEELSPEQLDALLKALDDEPNRQVANLMKMALYTGMRRGELFRLKWQDIDYARNTIHLRDPKGGIDQKIPLSDSARAILEGHEKTGSPFVFPGRGGGQRKDIKKQVNRIKIKAGIPDDFRALHGLRHVYASTLASSGKVDMYTIQKLMTHKSPQMTQRYAHLRDETLQIASNVAGDIIDRIGKKEPEKVKSLRVKRK